MTETPVVPSYFVVPRTGGGELRLPRFLVLTAVCGSMVLNIAEGLAWGPWG